MNNNLRFKTKLFFLLFMLIPFAGISQTKNVYSITRLFPKADKVLEFEKALSAHAKKYHSGDVLWRVLKIQSGPDMGGYQVTEGPTNWDALNTRGNLGEEHNNDWNKSVTIYLTDKVSGSYGVYQEDMSTVKLTDYSDKIIITHIFPKPGMVNGMIGLIKKQKKVWEAGNESQAVFSIISSGPPQYTVVTRLKAGLKELDDSFRKPFAERYNAIYGEGAWNYWLDDYSKYIESRWSEMLFLRADLGSK